MVAIFDNIKSSFFSEKKINIKDNIKNAKAISSYLNKEQLLEIINVGLLKSIDNVKEELGFNIENKIFFNKKAPKITIFNYIKRIFLLSNAENSTIIISIILLERFLNLNNFKLSLHNVYKIYFVSVMISIKYNEDYIIDNKSFAKIAGLKNEELNDLEIKFLKNIDYRVYVSYNEYCLYLKKVVNFIQFM